MRTALKHTYSNAGIELAELTPEPNWKLASGGWECYLLPRNNHEHLPDLLK